ncbi:MAG: efflux RND transporter permease subunit [Pseudomonadota bacterium]
MYWALRHPVSVIPLFAVMVLGGVLSWPSLPVDLLPSFSYPRLTIVTSFGQASPEETEALITRPVESAVGTIAGLRATESVSTSGVSSVMLLFDWGEDMHSAAAEVREKLDLIADELPRDVKPPLVLHYNPAEAPVVVMALYGPAADSTELRTIAETALKPDLETAPGVAAVRVTGGLVREIQVRADRGRLVAHRTDLRTLVEKIENANINFPGGKIVRGTIELALRTVGRFKTLEEIRNLPVGGGSTGTVIRLADVADVVETHHDRTAVSRVNGRPAVLIGIIKEPDANTVQVNAEIGKRLAGLRRALPQGARLEIVEESGPFIESALTDLRNMVLSGSMLAFVVLLASLRNAGSAVLIMLSIPVSLISTFGFMSLFRVSLNFMSIGGLALGVGMLVDSSIVVLESIHRKQASIPDIVEASACGIREVGSSVVSGTATTLVVLVPILFMTGLGRRLFQDFAFTLAAALLISLAASLVLLPALLVLIHRGLPYEPADANSRTAVTGNGDRDLVSPSRALNGEVPLNRALSKGGREDLPGNDAGLCISDETLGNYPMQAAYGRVLLWSLRHRFALIVLFAVVLSVSVWAVGRLGFEVLPDVEQDTFTVKLVLPPACSLSVMERAIAQTEAMIRRHPGVLRYVSKAGTEPKRTQGDVDQVGKPDEAEITVTLKPSMGRTTNVRDRIVETLRRGFADLPEVSVNLMLRKNFLAANLGETGIPEILRVVGDDQEMLCTLGDRLIRRLRDLDCLKDITAEGNVRVKQEQVVVDRYQAAAMRLTVDDAAETVGTAIEGKVAGEFVRNGREIDIRVRLAPQYLHDVDDVASLPLVHSSPVSSAERYGEQDMLRRESDIVRAEEQEKSTVIPLCRVAHIKSARGPREIVRIDRRKSVLIRANVVGRAFSQGQAMALREAKGVALPEGYEVRSGSAAFELVSSLSSLAWSLGLAVLLIYVVLVVQFESLLWPFLILTTIPATIAGPALVLTLGGFPVSLLVLFGALVLVGVVVNNAILMVTSVNLLRAQGIPCMEAIIQGAQIRLRPIIASTATTIVGALPVCLGWGNAAALRRPLALAVTSGLASSLLFTLLLVPVLYSVLATIFRPDPGRR